MENLDEDEDIRPHTVRANDSKVNVEIDIGQIQSSSWLGKKFFLSRKQSLIINLWIK